MSRRVEPSLHIEWSSDRVAAVDIRSGESAVGANVAEVVAKFRGHSHALVGVGRGHVFLKTVRLPKAAPADLRRIAVVQIAQLFPLPPTEISFDIHQTEQRNAEGLLTVIAAVRTSDLKRIQSELKQSNVAASRVLPVAFGAAAVATKAGVEDALVIESSPTGLSLDVVQGGSLRFSRLVPAQSDPDCEARRTLAAAQVEDLPIVAAGGLPIADSIVSMGTSLASLGDAPPFSFELAEDRIREIRKQASTRTRLAGLMLAAAILMLTLVWSERSDQAAVVNAGAAKWNGKLNKLRSIRDDATDKAGKASSIDAALNRAFDPAQPPGDVISVVGDALPTGVWLTGVNAERGKPVQIRGTAKTSDQVARYVQALGDSQRFRDVKLVFTNDSRIEEHPVVQFNVSATAVGNLPMPEPPKKVLTVKKATSGSGSEPTQ